MILLSMSEWGVYAFRMHEKVNINNEYSNKKSSRPISTGVTIVIKTHFTTLFFLQYNKKTCLDLDYVIYTYIYLDIYGIHFNE